MTFRSPRSPLARFSGFTLIELLTVIAIIGILAAIIIPVAGGVRDSAKKTKVQVQFKSWTQGVLAFKNAYGYFPKFEAASNADNHKVNGGVSNISTSMAKDDYLFRELLSGQGAKLVAGSFQFESNEGDSSKKQNKSRTKFVPFDVAEITTQASGDLLDGAVKDSFGNVEIAVIVDRNGDGFVNATDLLNVTVFPALGAHEERGTLTSAQVKARVDAADPGGLGVRADVIFYSPGKGVTPGKQLQEKDAVWSW